MILYPYGIFIGGAIVPFDHPLSNM